MLAIAFVWGMWTESFDRLWQAQFLTSVGFPSVGGLSDVVWIGLLTGAAMVIGIVVTQVAARRLEDATRDRARARAARRERVDPRRGAPVRDRGRPVARDRARTRP